jgi:hypothetical protein
LEPYIQQFFNQVSLMLEAIFYSSMWCVQKF